MKWNLQKMSISSLQGGAHALLEASLFNSTNDSKKFLTVNKEVNEHGFTY